MTVGLTSTPTTILLDHKGIVRWSYSGVLSTEQVNELKSLLSSSASI
jgi:predicted transcriptional regulator